MRVRLWGFTIRPKISSMLALDVKWWLMSKVMADRYEVLSTYSVTWHVHPNGDDRRNAVTAHQLCTLNKDSTTVPIVIGLVGKHCTKRQHVWTAAHRRSSLFVHSLKVLTAECQAFVAPVDKSCLPLMSGDLPQQELYGIKVTAPELLLEQREQEEVSRWEVWRVGSMFEYWPLSAPEESLDLETCVCVGELSMWSL